MLWRADSWLVRWGRKNWHMSYTWYMEGDSLKAFTWCCRLFIDFMASRSKIFWLMIHFCIFPVTTSSSDFELGLGIGPEHEEDFSQNEHHKLRIVWCTSTLALHDMLEPIRGRTPLLLAAFNNHIEAAELLLAARASPHTKANNGQGHTATLGSAMRWCPQCSCLRIF